MVNGTGGVMGERHIHEHTHDHVCDVKCLSWTAVICGALIGIGLGFLFNLFNIAIGLSVLNTSPAGQLTLAIGGFVGMLIGVIISMFLAGWVAGYMGRPFCVRRNLGILYGFTTWALMLVITIVLASSAGQFVEAYSNNIANPTSVIITNNPAAPTVSQTSSGEKTMVNAEKASKVIGLGAFVVFVLFFIGAVSACFGAHYGMVNKDKEWD